MKPDDLSLELDVLELELEAESEAGTFGAEFEGEEEGEFAGMEEEEDPFAEDFGEFEVKQPAPKPPPPKPNCQNYVPILKRIIALAKKNPALRRCLCYHVCHKGANPGAICSRFKTLITSVIRILRLCPQFRVPFCRALCG